jgi:hypothetical protein
MNYELLAQCIRSGQMDAAQVAEALRDEVFAAWYRRHFPA